MAVTTAGQYKHMSISFQVSRENGNERIWACSNYIHTTIPTYNICACVNRPINMDSNVIIRNANMTMIMDF